MPNTALDLGNLHNIPFGQQVFALRELFGFTQKEFAGVLCVNEKTIRRWEKGEDAAPQEGNVKALEALRTMAEALGELFEPDTIKVWVDRENPALNGER